MVDDATRVQFLLDDGKKQYGEAKKLAAEIFHNAQRVRDEGLEYIRSNQSTEIEKECHQVDSTPADPSNPSSLNPRFGAIWGHSRPALG